MTLIKRVYHLIKSPYRKHKLFSWIASIRLFVQLKVLMLLANKSKPIHFFVLPEHMGDIVACFPVAEDIKAKNPHIKLIWITRTPYHDLVNMSPHVDHVLTIPCVGCWSRNASVLPASSVTDFTFNNRECFHCQTLHRKTAFDANVNLANYYDHGSLLEAFCKANKYSLPKNHYATLDIPPDAEQNVNELRLPDNFVAIHTSSNEAVRDWSPEKWSRLIDRIFSQHNLKSVEVGAGSSKIPDSPNLIKAGEKNLSLPETAALIRRSKLFVGIDSGPAHIANAFQIKGAILLGKYRAFSNYMPYSGFYAVRTNCQIVRAENGPAEAIEVHDVESAVSFLLAEREI